MSILQLVIPSLRVFLAKRGEKRRGEETRIGDKRRGEETRIGDSTDERSLPRENTMELRATRYANSGPEGSRYSGD
jgi:hypothetical protein